MHPTRNTISRALAPLAPLSLLGFEAGAVVFLHRLGSVAFLRLPPPVAGAWQEWLRSGDPADVLAALVRAATLGAAWWLLVSTILYLAARLLRSVSGVRLAGWIAPAVVRRCVDGMVAVSVAGVLAGGRTGTAWAVGSPQPPAGRAAAPLVLPTVSTVTFERPCIPARCVAPPLRTARVRGARRALRIGVQGHSRRNRTSGGEHLAPGPGMRPGSPPAAGGGIVLRADLGRGIVFPLGAPGLAPAGPAPVTPLADHQIVPGGTLAPRALLPAPPSLAIPPSPSGAEAEPPTAAGRQQAPEPPGASGPPGVPLSAGDGPEGSPAWTVQPGDSLWAMAARAVGAAPPDALRTAPYWARVVAANRRSIASGNPDLIRPGEAIVMPPLGPRGAPGP